MPLIAEAERDPCLEEFQPELMARPRHGEDACPVPDHGEKQSAGRGLSPWQVGLSQKSDLCQGGWITLAQAEP